MPIVDVDAAIRSLGITSCISPTLESQLFSSKSDCTERVRDISPSSRDPSLSAEGSSVELSPSRINLVSSHTTSWDKLEKTRDNTSGNSDWAV